ncbi:MAG: DUF3566 domain-containing protein [Ilumatobacteraceae bacterium]
MTDEPTSEQPAPATPRRPPTKRAAPKATQGTEADVPTAPRVEPRPATRTARPGSGSTERTPKAAADDRSTQQIPSTPAPDPVRGGSTSLFDALDRLEPLEPRGPFELPDIVPAEASNAGAASAAAAMPIAAPDATGPLVMGRRRPRVRRVTRVVRHIDTWSVFKVAGVFSLFLYVVLLTAGVLLWKVAENTGTIDNVERFFESFGWQTFDLKGGEVYHNAWIAGLFVAVGLTGLAVLAATLFNLITDLVGGVRVSVLEEEVVATDLGRRSRAGELFDRFTSGFR